MTMQPQTQQTSWQVTGQTEYTQVGATGPPVAGVKVYFTTGQGHSGSVFLPAASYNVANVRAAVAAQAEQMDAVGSLSSGS
jgi:hypothetical protein